MVGESCVLHGKREAGRHSKSKRMGATTQTRSTGCAPLPTKTQLGLISHFLSQSDWQSRPSYIPTKGPVLDGQVITHGHNKLQFSNLAGVLHAGTFHYSTLFVAFESHNTQPEYFCWAVVLYTLFPFPKLFQKFCLHCIAYPLCFPIYQPGRLE